MPNGRDVFDRTAAHASTILLRCQVRALTDPSAPASHTAATSAGVSPPPAMGAWIIGCRRPSRSVRTVLKACRKRVVHVQIEGHERDAVEMRLVRSRFAERNGGRLVERIPADAAADRRKRDRARMVLACERQCVR